ncbi:MAG: hypothetical protein CL940_10640 [Deltaproteobacteria bacterium]|nr:hypothetical protein [Deltaproteobacteria bacterium]
MAAMSVTLLLACESDSGSSSSGELPSPELDATPTASDTTGGDSASIDGVSSADVPVDGGRALDATTSQEDVSSEEVIEDAGGGTTPDAAPAMDVVVGEGACTNDSDLAVLADFDVAKEQMAIGMSCYEAAGGPGQTSAEEVKACFIEKLSSDYGFSQQCSVCVTNQLMCLQEHCMEACMSSMMSGVTSPACEACIESNGCKSDFVECSGLNPDIFSP